MTFERFLKIRIGLQKLPKEYITMDSIQVSLGSDSALDVQFVGKLGEWLDEHPNEYELVQERLHERLNPFLFATYNDWNVLAIKIEIQTVLYKLLTD